MTGPTIKLTIDGIPVEVEKGKTILEAAQCAGIRIPTLCHDRRLVPFGACRLCVVEEKGKSELLPSCFSPAPPPGVCHFFQSSWAQAAAMTLTSDRRDIPVPA